MSTPELKPCPFCGGGARKVSSLPGGEPIVSCCNDDCGASICCLSRKEWNRRTSSDAALRDAVLEEAIATLGRIMLPAVISPHYDGVRDGVDLAVEAIRALSTSQEQPGLEGQKPHSHLD